MGFLGFNFNLLDQLTFYGSYHQKPGNQIIHFFFVPMILWSVGVWLAYTGPLSQKIDLPSLVSFLPDIVAQAFVFNLDLIVMAAYSIYYILLEAFAGLSWTLLMGLHVYWTSTLFQQHVPYAWAIASGTFILGWFMQIQIGHAMIEHKRPALLDSFFQSLVLAPLFAWMEALFHLGYRPKLLAELQRRIHEKTSGTSAKEALLDAHARVST